MSRLIVSSHLSAVLGREIVATRSFRRRAAKHAQEAQRAHTAQSDADRSNREGRSELAGGRDHESALVEEVRPHAGRESTGRFEGALARLFASPAIAGRALFSQTARRLGERQ